VARAARGPRSDPAIVNPIRSHDGRVMPCA
jgi:hypothetical protein